LSKKLKNTIRNSSLQNNDEKKRINGKLRNVGIDNLRFSGLLFPPPPASSGFLNIFIDWQILLIELLGIAILSGIALLITYKK